MSPLKPSNFHNFCLRGAPFLARAVVRQQDVGVPWFEVASQPGGLGPHGPPSKHRHHRVLRGKVGWFPLGVRVK